MTAQGLPEQAASSPNQKPDVYRCSVCKEHFEVAWEQAAAQKAARFGSGANPRDVFLLCDSCYDEIIGNRGLGL